MPRGEKTKYSNKQKRQAKHIEKGYEERGTKPEEAKKRAWATVNKMHGGGAKGGSGTDKVIDSGPSKKGGRRGGSASKASSKK